MKLDFKGLITVPIHNVPVSALSIQHNLLLAFVMLDRISSPHPPKTTRIFSYRKVAFQAIAPMCEFLFIEMF